MRQVFYEVEGGGGKSWLITADLFHLLSFSAWTRRRRHLGLFIHVRCRGSGPTPNIFHEKSYTKKMRVASLLPFSKGNQHKGKVTAIEKEWGTAERRQATRKRGKCRARSSDLWNHRPAGKGRMCVHFGNKWSQEVPREAGRGYNRRTRFPAIFYFQPHRSYRTWGRLLISA